MFDAIVKGITLEVLKSLPDDTFDMGVTSPPYNKKSKGSKGSNSIFGPIEYDSFDDNLPEDIYQKDQIDVLNELYRIMKPGGSFFYNHKLRQLNGTVIHPMEWMTKTNWTLRQEIIWDRSGPIEVSGYRFYQVDERIYWMYKPVTQKKVCGEKLLGKHARMKSVWKFAPDKKNPHPAPFPIVLPLRCILSFMNDRNGVVIDPYSGSGTTLVAAKLLGKNYFGIDVSDNYIEMAEQR